MANRVEPLLDGNQNRSPERNMELLLTKLSPAVIVPQPNKYYTFVYKAKTRNIVYDQHPCILCGNVYKWGFNGSNIHWQDIRQYTWQEVRSNLFELSDEEFESMQNYNTARLRNS